MDPKRLKALYQPNKVQIKKGRKPVLLHGAVNEPLDEREQTIATYKAAIQRMDKMRYQAKILRHVKLSDEKLRSKAEKEISSSRTRMAKMSQEVQPRGEESQREILDLRKRSDAASAYVFPVELAEMRLMITLP